MVRRRHRRSPFKKALIPLMLVMALIFSSVVSVGFAKWQDELTIVSDVTVTGKKLDVTLARHNPYTGSAAQLESDLENQDKADSIYWTSYMSYGATLRFLWWQYWSSAAMLSYEIPASVDNSNDTIKIYDSILSANEFTTTFDNLTDGVGGRYSATVSNGGNISFMWEGNTTNALDSEKSKSVSSNVISWLPQWLVGEDAKAIFKHTDIPVAVTFTNSNNWDIVIKSNGIASGNGTASITQTNGTAIPAAGLTVPANGTLTILITPTNYQNFVAKFTDDSNETYLVTINFETYTSNVSGASAASAAAYSYRPSTTTTTTTTVAEETTTAGEETTTSATTTETSAGETETTTTTEATESTTSAETTTTTAPTSAAEVTTTASTTAATAAVTTVPTSAATSAQAETQPTESGAE